MSLLNLQNLGLNLSVDLFRNLNLVVGEGERLGIVAANGRGKSSLLRIINTELDPTEGEVTRARGSKTGTVAQYVPQDWMERTLYNVVLGGLDEDAQAHENWRVDIILDDLNVPAALRDRPMHALSGGWQRLALLARTQIAEPDLLLLDEPTNHLDLEKIRLLEDWLRALPRSTAVMMCSHDRAFLDAVTKRTLFLRPENSQIFALPYSKARAALDEADAADSRQYQKQIKTAQQLRKQAAKLNNIGINSGSDLLVNKTKQLKERAGKLEDTARPAHLERSAGAIKLSGQSSHVRALVTLDGLDVATPDHQVLYKTGRLWINPGDRIVVLGANGAGKTRLLTMVRNVIAGIVPDTAHLKATPSLVLGYSDQALSELDERQTPHEIIIRRFDVGDQKARSLLAGAGMTIDLQGKAVVHLSGGQKARLGMLVLRLTQPNFYILDEPTNHLDIDGQEALESELLNSEAACLLVSHDRSFVRNTGNRFWQIDRKKLIEVDTPAAFFAQSGRSAS